MKSALLSLAVLSAAAPAPLKAEGPGSATPFNGKRVLFVGIDGLRSDALRKAIGTGMAPHLKALVDSGTVTWNAFAGGHPAPSATSQPTISGPGWTSLLTGTWMDRHHVNGNSSPAYDEPATDGSYLVSQAPAFARRLKDAEPAASVVSIASWDWIEDYFVAAQPAAFSWHGKGIGGTYAVRDQSVADQAQARLGSSDPDVLLLHFDQVDGAGHAGGYSPDNAAYLNAVANVDAHIGTVLAAIKARPQHAAEQWLTIVSTDHGGTGTGHGGQTPGERTIFLIASGPGVAVGRVTGEIIGQPALAHTVFKHLGVAVNPAWQWAERPFAVAPSAIVSGVGTRAFIEVVQPPGGSVPGCTGIELFRNGSLVSTQPANVTTFSDAPPLPPAGAVPFTYEIRWAGTGVTPVPATITLAAAAGANLATDLVVDLPFDGNSQDASPRGNHATVTGTAGYTTGRTGQALVLSGAQFATLPAGSADLKFGADANFTVAFWIQAPTQWTSDPVLISNKNWDSGANQGWVIACQNLAANNTSWQWNFKGVLQNRRDFDGGGVIRTGGWHHVAVSHNRTGNADFYADGNHIGSVSLSGAGDADTAFPIHLGRDGNGGNALNVSMAMDDLKIWRRALTAAEIRSLVPLPPPDVTTGLVLDLPFDGSAADNSGRGNHGVLQGGSAYAAGRNGQALVLNGAQFVSLGQPSDLQFGAATDFTIAAWVRSTNPWTADPVLISNKDWASGTNVGWFLGGQTDGSTWQWNFKGAAAVRKDFETGGAISDGAWHHLAVSHRRAGFAEMYHDGVFLGSVAIAGAGSTDTTAPLGIHIGRDGTGTAYAWSSDLLVDDLKIWRRALSSADIAQLAPPPPAGYSAWRQENFSRTQAADPALSSPAADPDNDGLTNLQECAFRFAPLQPGPSPTTSALGGITFPIPAGGVGDPANGYSAGGIRFRLETSSDLSAASWTPTANLPPALLSPGPSGTVLATITVPAGVTPRRFLRVRLEQAD
ncbi:MAG: alkaline phosphatase family protein [Verrucomicrobiales bacterium]|nr:alkaline phosphatase family protein [Verrucomicrobiales bacterium]